MNISLNGEKNDSLYIQGRVIKNAEDGRQFLAEISRSIEAVWPTDWESGRKPWEADGISERAWYKRKAKEREAGKP